ncbi:MAG: 4Fe-4S binding protein [Nitrospinota bacterium]|nr:4Fe-4S binding protein [Nitrospinota bacterium]
MGHASVYKEDLIPLIDRLNKYPVGLVDNDKLRRILSILFDEEEAFVGSRFPLEEATLAELCDATGMDEGKLAPILERMAEKGLVADMPYRGITYYLLIPGLIGFFEFTFMKNRTDIPMDKVARLMAEYLEERGRAGQTNEILRSGTQLTRALTYEDKIPISSKVTSYEDAREIIRNSSFGAAGMCYCRHKKEHEGKTCKRGAPIDGICITLGEGARFLVRRGFQQRKSVEELLAILDRAKSYNLTYITDNVRDKPTFICNCCRCCCVLMHGVQMGYPDGVAKTPFIAHIDPDLCDYCGKCVAMCNVKGIGAGKSGSNGDTRRFGVVDTSICLGCGACLSTCEKNAITLTERSIRPIPPRTHDAKFSWIMIEKGRYLPLFFSRVRKVARNIYATLSGKGSTRPMHMLDT